MNEPSLGQRLLRVLLSAWLLCLVLAVAAGFLLGENVLFDLLLVLLLLSVALVAAPAVLFLAYAERHPAAAVPQDLRRSAIGSGVSNLVAAAVLWSFPRPALVFVISAAVLAALAALVLVRVLRLAPPDTAMTGAPTLRHRGVTVTGVVTIVLFVILAAKL